LFCIGGSCRRQVEWQLEAAFSRRAKFYHPLAESSIKRLHFNSVIFAPGRLNSLV
jgi:hypothetical protein